MPSLPRAYRDFTAERDKLRQRGVDLGLPLRTVEEIFREVDVEALGRPCGTPIWRNHEARLRIDRAARGGRA